MAETIDFGPAGPRCAEHADRPAVRTCARCGSFICSGCIISGELCPTCKGRLLKAGVPWSPHERARAAARKARRWSGRLLRTMAVAGGGGSVAWAGVGAGSLPGFMRPFGSALLLLAGLLGVGAAVSAALGWRHSERGRPGPAVPGVYPAGVAATMAALGLAPGLAALAAWLA